MPAKRPCSAAIFAWIGCTDCSNQVLLIGIPVIRIGSAEIVGQRFGERQHRSQVVPDVRVITLFSAHQVSHDDGLAIGAVCGAQQLLYLFDPTL
jgi:hypothetical protein